MQNRPTSYRPKGYKFGRFIDPAITFDFYAIVCASYSDAEIERLQRLSWLARI